MKSGSTNNSYTIFDPTGAYLQAGIFDMEYGPALSDILASEQNFTTVTLPQLLAKVVGGTRLNPISYTVRASDYALLNDDTLRNIANLGINMGTNDEVLNAHTLAQFSKRDAKKPGYFKQNMSNRGPPFLDDPTVYYKLRDTNFMNVYSRGKEFISHPIAFILSGKHKKLKMNCGYRSFKNDIIKSTGGTNALTITNLYDTAKELLRYQYGEGVDGYNNRETSSTLFNLFNIIEVSRYRYDNRYVRRDTGDTNTCYPYDFDPYEVCTNAMSDNHIFQTPCPGGTYRSRTVTGQCDGTCVSSDYRLYFRSQGDGYYGSLDSSPHFISNCYASDGANKINPSHPSKYCKEIADEIADPTISTNILTAGNNWTVSSFMTTVSANVSNLIDAYKSVYSSGPYKTIPVVGTIDALAKTEIEKSIGYAMYFNFTDADTLQKQILISSTPPCNLYMSKTASASVEFSTNMTAQTINISTLAVESNAIKANTPITDDMMKMLPYHTRNYIRRWAISRRERIASLYLQTCNASKTSLDATYTSSKSDWDNYSASKPANALVYINFKVLGDGTTPGTWPPNSSQTRSGNDELTSKYPFDVLNTLNIACSVNASTQSIPNLYNPATWEGKKYTLTVENESTEGVRDYIIKNISGMTSTIQNRTYSEIYPYYGLTPTTDVAKRNVATNNISDHDIAPKFDLMSVSNSDPAVFSAATNNTIVTLTNTTGTPYTTSITIQKNVAFISTNMTIVLTDMSDPTTYLTANVASYSQTSGALTLNNINIYNVYVRGEIQKAPQTSPWKPFGLNEKYYQISYTSPIDTTYTGTDSEIKTVYAQQINPKVSINVELTIRTTNLLSANLSVTVSDYSEPSKYFNATIVSYTESANKRTAIVVLRPTRVVGTFNTRAVTYVISLGSNSAGRHWLSVSEKRTILNMIAQFYYENAKTSTSDTGGNTEMNMILDVFQVGDLLYDVRFIDLRRDARLTESIAAKIDTLRTNHETYRRLLLAQDERAVLEDEYNTQMIDLNAQLNDALLGIGKNCGVLKAQRVRLIRTDTSTTGISLAQIIIVDNTGSNVAYTKPVNTNSTEIPRYLKNSSSSGVITTSAENGICRIASTGAIICTNNGVATAVAPAGTCLRIQGTEGNYTSINCSTVGNAVSITPTSSNNISFADTLLIYKQNQLLTDGNYIATRNTNTLTNPVTNVITTSTSLTFTWKTLPWAGSYYYKSSGNTTREYVEIDLLAPADITGIYIIYPMGYTEIPTYSVELYDTDGLRLGFEAGDVSTITRANSTSDNSYLSLLKKSRDPTLPGCTSSLNEPYTVARFYSKIDKDVYNNNSGNPIAQLSGLTFTGYSLGTEAALTFNPKYNAGFIVDTSSGLGNTNYRPVISYTKNIPSTSNPLPQSDLCLNIPRAMNIIYDHYTSLRTYEFTERSDVKNLNAYDTSEYVYKPLKILGLAKNTDNSCGIKWSEIRVNPITNVSDPPKEYYGIFRYRTNTENWGATNSYYDIPGSLMFNSLADYTANSGNPLDLTKTADFEFDLPAEGTLDNLGGTCQPASCTDINVINNIVQSYNEDISNTSKKIIRITQAVTVSPFRCDFKGIIRTQNGDTNELPFSIDVEAQVKMKLDRVNSLELADTECKYVYKAMRISGIDESGGGEFIQSNTPYLLKTYNYAAETLKPYVNFFNNTIYKSLYDTVGALAPELRSSLLTYRKDMYGAYGQLNTLVGGTCKETDVRNVCTDPATVNEFMKAYRKYRVANSANDPGFISTITHAGTAYNNTCDYVADVYTLSVNSSSVPVTTNPRSEVYRVKMNPVRNTCYFITTVDLASNITSSANTDVNYENLTIINYTGENYLERYLGSGSGSVSSSSITSLELNISGLIIGYNQPVLLRYGVVSLNGYVTPATETTESSTTATTTSINISNVFNVGSFPSGPLTFGIYTSNILCQATGIISNPQPNQSITLAIYVTLNDSYIGLPVIAESGLVKMNGVIQFYSESTITIGSVSNVQGTFSNSSQTYVIIINEVKQMQLDTVPTALNRNIWETPVTLGTQTTNTTLVFTSDTLTLNIPSLQYTLNRPVYVVDMNNSANNFNANMTAYVNSVLTLGSVTNKNGIFTSPTKYRIFSKLPSRSPVPIPLVEMIDYVDCANNPYTPGSTNVIGKAYQCSNGVTFSKSSDLAINSVVSSSSSNSSSTITLPVPIPSPFLPYRDVVTSVVPEAIASDTYEFRVTTQDYLPYGDTYKMIQFYNKPASSQLRVLKVTDSNGETSNFSFFVKNSISIGNNLTSVINCARDSWNIEHLAGAEPKGNSEIIGSESLESTLNLTKSSTTVSLNISSLTYTENLPVTVIDINNPVNSFNAIMKSYTGTILTLGSISNINGRFENLTTYKIVISDIVTLAPSSIPPLQTRFKSVIKTIHSYHIPENKNVIIFKATAADFGINGETDIRLYGIARYFKFEFRRKFGSTELTYNSIPVVSSSNRNGTWQLNPNNTFFVYFMEEVNYTEANLPVFTELTPPNIAIVPVGTTGAVPASSTTLGIKATYIVQSLRDALISSKKFKYLRLKFTASASNLTYGEITYIKFYSTNLVNPSYATITNSNSILNLQYASFTVEGILPIKYYLYDDKNTCDIRSYTQSIDAEGTTFGVCTLINPPIVTMRTRIFTYNNYDYTLPCPIGYESSSSTSDTCISTGNYRKVNLVLEATPNPTIQRLKLPLNTYMYINLNDEVQINYFTFTTGASSARPTGWVLEGSMSGNPSKPDEWITLHTTSGYGYSEAPSLASGRKEYSFVQTSCFPILTGGVVSPTSTTSVGSGLGYNFAHDPSTDSLTPIIETFKNPAKSLLKDSAHAVFETQPAPKLDFNYTLPLQTGVVPKYTIPERRIQYLRFTVTQTRKQNSQIVHMSMLQFITPLGPLPIDMYTISNPMGVHPTSKTGPAALSSPTGRWVNLNRNPLLIKFGNLPATLIQGFKFSVPSGVKNSEDGVPCQWLIESSYDGRFWETFEQTDRPMIFTGQTSPVYTFIKEI